MSLKTITADDADVLFNSVNGTEHNGWTRVDEQHRRTSRWENHYWLVLRDSDDLLWGLPYTEGLTEVQETVWPWDEPGDPDRPLELTRLYPHPVTTIEYRDSPSEGGSTS